MKIAIIGTHSTGKTTLIHLIVDALKRKNETAEYLPELSRLCPFEINENTSFEAQSWILHNQIEKEKELYREGAFLVCDRATIDNYAYMFRNARKQNIDTTKEELLAAEHMQTYDLVFKTRKLDVEAEEDGVRSTDAKFRDTIDKLIEHFLNKHSIPYMLLPDTLDYNTHVNLIMGKLLPSEPFMMPSNALSHPVSTVSI